MKLSDFKKLYEDWKEKGLIIELPQGGLELKSDYMEFGQATLEDGTKVLVFFLHASYANIALRFETTDHEFLRHLRNVIDAYLGGKIDSYIR